MCTHVHVCACSEDTPRLAQSFCVSVSSPAQLPGRIQVPYAKKSLHLYNKAIPHTSQKWAGHLWCTCSSAWQRFNSRPWGSGWSGSGAQVVVQQLWRPPPRTAVLFGSLPAGTRLSKVLVQMSAYPGPAPGRAAVRLSGAWGPLGRLRPKES